MKYCKKIPARFWLLFLTIGLIAFIQGQSKNEEIILSYIVNPKLQDIQLYWKNKKGLHFKNFQNLKNDVESNKQTLVFAMNGGMYREDLSPQGLFIENNQTLNKIDTGEGNGNFYLKPNGIFYLTKNKIAGVCKSYDFPNNQSIKYATQSGPMLVIDGQIHPAFKAGSSNLNIRNGVGIMPNNQVVFAMSKKAINFYDFAKFFQDLGVKNALYLDGFVSRTYLPEKNMMQLDGNFGVMIAVTKKMED